MPPSQQFVEVLREWSEVFMHRSMRDFKRFMNDSGLSMPQISTLMRLYHHGECAVSEVADDLGVTNAAASQMVERLVQLGLLERAENPSDRRAKQLTLTPKGRALIQKSLEARRRWMEELIAALTPERRKAIMAALLYLTEAAHRLEPKD
jgi:DNA-binding MarR family transcriptional regulator